MSIRFLPTASLLLVLLGGCRTNPHTQVYIDNVNAEKRLLEDTLYDLQYDYECNLKELEKVRAELAHVRGGKVSDAPTGIRKPSPPPAANSVIAPDDLAPPVVEPGTPVAPVAPDKDEPQPPQELDDLEMSPPKLELGPPQGSASVSLGDPAALVSRWTPRAQTRPRPETPRVDVAQQTPETPAPAGGSVPQSAGGSLSDAQPTPASPGGAASSQARRPQWRPHR